MAVSGEMTAATMRPVAGFPRAARARVRAVLTDIDDTLTSHGRLPAVAYAALENLRAAGLLVVPVTGRPALTIATPVEGENGRTRAVLVAHMDLAQVDTPALLLDLDAFELNLARLTESLRGTSVRVRPHAKSHKCPEIALRQIARGAVGVCCQKVSEAEALVHGGVGDVLVANEVVGPKKLARLAELARQAHMSVCVDDAGNVADLAQAVRAAGVTLDVLVEVKAME